MKIDGIILPIKKLKGTDPVSSLSFEGYGLGPGSGLAFGVGRLLGEARLGDRALGVTLQLATLLHVFVQPTSLTEEGNHGSSTSCFNAMSLQAVFPLEARIAFRAKSYHKKITRPEFIPEISQNTKMADNQSKQNSDRFVTS